MPDGLHSATESVASRAKTKAKFSSRNVSTLYKAPSAVIKGADGFQGGAAGANRLLVLRPPARGPLAASKANAVAAPTPINTPSLRKEHETHDVHVRPLASSKVGWGDNQDQEHSERDQHGSPRTTESRQPENSNVSFKPKAWGSPEDTQSNQAVASPTLQEIAPLINSGRWGDDAVEEDLLLSEIQREKEHEREFPDLHRAISNSETHHRHHYGQPSSGYHDDHQYFVGSHAHHHPRDGYYAHYQYNAYHDNGRNYDRHSERTAFSQPRYAAHDVSGRHEEYYAAHRHHVSNAPRSFESDRHEYIRHVDHGVVHVPSTHTHFGPQDARFDYMFASDDRSRYDAYGSNFSRFQNNSTDGGHRSSAPPCDQRRGIRAEQGISCGHDGAPTTFGHSQSWRQHHEVDEPQRQDMSHLPTKSCEPHHGQSMVELPIEKPNSTSPSHRTGHAPPVSSPSSSVWAMSEAEVASTRVTQRGADMVESSTETRAQASGEGGESSQVRILKRTGPRMLFDPKSGTMVIAEVVLSRPQKASRECTKRADEDKYVESYSRETSSKRSSRRKTGSSSERVSAALDAGSQGGDAIRKPSQQSKIREGNRHAQSVDDSSSTNLHSASATHESTNQRDRVKKNVESVKAQRDCSSEIVSPGNDVIRRRFPEQVTKDGGRRFSAVASRSTSTDGDLTKDPACTRESASPTNGGGNASSRSKGQTTSVIDESTQRRRRQSQLDRRDVAVAPRAVRSRRAKAKILRKDSALALEHVHSNRTAGDQKKVKEGSDGSEGKCSIDQSIPATAPTKPRTGVDVNEMKSITLAGGAVVIDDVNMFPASEVEDDGAGFETVKSRKSILRERRIERERATRNCHLPSGCIVVSTVSSRRGKRALTVTVNRKINRGEGSHEKDAKQSKSERKSQRVEVTSSIREQNNTTNAVSSPSPASANVDDLPGRCRTTTSQPPTGSVRSRRTKSDQTRKQEGTEERQRQVCTTTLSPVKSEDQLREHVTNLDQSNRKPAGSTQRRTRGGEKTARKASRVYVPKKQVGDEAIHQVSEISNKIDSRSRTSSTESASSKSSEVTHEVVSKGKKTRGNSDARLPNRTSSGEANKRSKPVRTTRTARSKDSVAQSSCSDPVEDPKRGEAEKQNASSKKERRGVAKKDGTASTRSSQRSRKLYVVKATASTSSCSAA
ncbi:hypothetical protein PINS_up007029 [Pythium insidiosum]|nr:hypothetical protein PINS_up007029 [Pythium insidiosum]